MMLLPSRTHGIRNQLSVINIQSVRRLVNNHAFCACHNRRHQRYDALLPVRERFDQLIFHHLIDWEFLFFPGNRGIRRTFDIPSALDQILIHRIFTYRFLSPESITSNPCSSIPSEKEIVPSSGSIKPHKVLMNVVFPVPFGAMMT